MQTKLKVRHLGSSIAIIIPDDIVKKHNLMEGDEIIIDIRKKNTARDAFCMLKDWKMESSKKEWVDVSS